MSVSTTVIIQLEELQVMSESVTVTFRWARGLPVGVIDVDLLLVNRNLKCELRRAGLPLLVPVVQAEAAH